MARILKGILGGFSGTVGTVVGSYWKGIDCMRSKPVRRSGASLTQAQIDQQLKFALAGRFVNSLGDLPEVTYHNFAVKQTGRNSMMAQVLKQAITGASPDFALDYNKVQISRGALPTATGASASAGIDKFTSFTWTNDAVAGSIRERDKAVLVVYCPLLNQSVCLVASATRLTGMAKLDTRGFNGFTVQTWIGFIAEDGKLAANSVYTGELVLA